VLCELARTDRHRFRLLEPDSDQTKALRALIRAREDLIGARVALANQPRAELERFWPGPISLFCDLDSPISLAFLTRYPSPADARGLGEKRLAAFLKAHRYTNRKTAAQLLERLRSAPAGRAGEIETRARRSIVLGLVRALEVMVAQIAELEREITDALDAHPDGEIVHRLGPDTPRELPDRGLVRYPLRQADPTEPAQMKRVRHLRHQRPIPPPIPGFQHRQPDIPLHRDRRPPIGQHQPASLGNLPSPPLQEHHRQLRI
jgi:Transposase